MQALIKVAIVALAVSATPAVKRDHDSADLADGQSSIRVSQTASVGSASGLASAITGGAASRFSIAPASVIATVSGPVPTQLPNGLFQCGSDQNGLGRYYSNTKYTCYDGNVLCPILSSGVRTKPCGPACYDPAVYSCDGNNQLFRNGNATASNNTASMARNSTATMANAQSYTLSARSAMVTSTRREMD